jgi:hypothetical protein
MVAGAHAMHTYEAAAGVWFYPEARVFNVRRRISAKRSRRALSALAI